jgi:unconventional prefoldin RPB5 interactor 1
MASTEHEVMADVERRRAQLEENVAKLRQSLKQWQRWEWEYEMFKEEIQSAGSPSSSQMVEIGRDLGCSLLTAKEVQDLVGKGTIKRTANQVIDMISRRVDYVQQNISSAQKQLDSAEKKLAGASVLLEPDLENEEGLPLMDIQEELDEAGNVISGAVSQPGKSAPEIVEALRKAGIKKLEQDQIKDSKTPSGESAPPSASTLTTPTTASRPENLPTGDVNAPQKNGSDTPKPPKKSVSFAEDTKSDPTASRKSGLEETGYNEDLADYNFTSGTKVIELDEDDNEIASYPIIPQGESEEDAALRRQMLQYGLSEVGNIVAEIDLDGPMEPYSDEEMDEDYDEEYDTEVSELEDEHGRSLRREVSDDYRKQMLELEEKLNARMLENVGPRPDSHPLAEYSDDVRTLRVRKDDASDEVSPVSKDVISDELPEPNPSTKKGVRFADNVGVSPDPQATKTSTESPQPTITSTPTISDTIVERTGPASQPPTVNPSKPAKVSRFKSSRTRAAQPPITMLPTPPVPEPLPVPQGPKGQPLASTIVEHIAPMSAPHVPDEFDPVVVNREVQTQYHKMRNKMIQQQGGFKPTEEEEEEDHPLMEEKNGKTKKVSRFRAARLKAEGADGS